VTKPPVAARNPVTVERFGESFEDPYGWLRDREDPGVKAHLEAENAYTDEVLGPIEDLRRRVFAELKARMQESDASAPIRRDDWWYYTRILEGQQYPVQCRRPVGDADRRFPIDPSDPPADEQVILDMNELAEGHDYLSLGGAAVSPDHRLLAYLVDTSGAEVFELRIRDLATGDERTVTGRATYGLAWHSDASALLYLVPDDAWRPHEVRRHVLRSDQHDALLLREDDERFWTSLSMTRSRDFVTIQMGSRTTSEVHLIDAHDPTALPTVVAPRDPGVEYHVDHGGGPLIIVTNAGQAVDFQVMTAPVETPGRNSWQVLVDHRPGVRVEDADAFATHVVVSERTEARTQLRVVDNDGFDHGVLDMPEDVYTAAVGPNPQADTRVLRILYTSLTTSLTTIDVDLDTGARETIKQDEVPGGYDPAQYVTTRLWATSDDGTQVPISVVAHRDTPVDGTAPCLLYAYGAYEVSTDPTFKSWRLSYLDRGGIVALAHVRGGGEMGRAWYEAGRLVNKPNTFRDVVACADHLVAQSWTSRDRLVLEGGSAGGLMVGATLNLRPDLVAAAVAVVPFVDVLNTMYDPTLPLTVPEYEEWGNPAEEASFTVIRSYSPYDNIRAESYPALLVTAGLNDPRVGYWEPAKWVARLREVTTGDEPILLRTELGAGHAGPSGRYSALEERALMLAFEIDRSGLPHDLPG